MPCNVTTKISPAKRLKQQGLLDESEHGERKTAGDA